MGLTIHYRGRINNLENVEKLTNELEDFSGQLGWKYKRWNNHWDKPNTVRIENQEGEIRFVGHAPLKGIDLFPHEDCEPFSLTFTPEGWLVSLVDLSLIADGSFEQETYRMSTKTQFAPLETHIIIIKLLEYLKKSYIHNLEVYDEGGYWETGDIEELKRRQNTIFGAMDTLEQGLSEIPFEHIANKTPKEIAEMIERMLKSPKE